MTAVTIVVPTHERLGHVETAIESALRQDHDDLEVIVIDDGSTDGTGELLARIAARTDPARLRVLTHPNAGQAASMNRGWREGRGELLGYLSSDDVLLPGAVSTLVAHAAAHPEAEVLYPRFRICDEADRVVDECRPEQHTWAHALRWAACVPGAGVLFRRSLFDRVGGWDPRYRNCPDLAFWLAARDAVFLRVPEALATWRHHDGSISVHQRLDGVRERLRLLDEVYAADDLPDDVLAVREEAYAALLIQCAIMLDGGNVGAPGARFAVIDQRACWISWASLESAATAYATVAAEYEKVALRLQAVERAHAAARQEMDALHATLAVREEHLRAVAGERDALLARVAEIDAAAVPAGPPPDRPLWLRTARRAVPAPLRPRAGAALHRLRGGA